MKKNGKGAAATAGTGAGTAQDDEELDENGQPKAKPKGEGEGDEELDENGEPKAKPKGEGEGDDDEELDDEEKVEAARAEAVAQERTRVKAIIALQPRAIAQPLQEALESGESVEAAAQRFLKAMQAPGAAALSAMQGAEAGRVMPTVSAGADAQPVAGAPTVDLLRKYSPTQRQRALRRG
jgi:hypothetical protein